MTNSAGTRNSSTVRRYVAPAVLTAREVEVLELMLDGLPNKRIATELGISERTVKARRGKIMRKMQADSVAVLVRKVYGCD